MTLPVATSFNIKIRRDVEWAASFSDCSDLQKLYVFNNMFLKVLGQQYSKKKIENHEKYCNTSAHGFE